MELNGKSSNGDTVVINLKKSYWAIGILVMLIAILSSIANITSLFSRNNNDAVAAFDFTPIEVMIKNRVEEGVNTPILRHNQDPGAHPTIIGVLNEIKTELRYMNGQLAQIRKEEEPPVKFYERKTGK